MGMLKLGIIGTGVFVTTSICHHWQRLQIGWKS
jgi:hypothetical protein